MIVWSKIEEDKVPKAWVIWDNEYSGYISYGPPTFSWIHTDLWHKDGLYLYPLINCLLRGDITSLLAKAVCVWSWNYLCILSSGPLQLRLGVYHSFCLSVYLWIYNNANPKTNNKNKANISNAIASLLCNITWPQNITPKMHCEVGR